MIATESIQQLFEKSVIVQDNMIRLASPSAAIASNQDQTREIFTDKWAAADKYENIQKLYEFQFDWFLSLYGFGSEREFAGFLSDKNVIVDTGCGLGYKAGWYAKLAPHAIVIGIDISDAVSIAAENFKPVGNLYFYKGDIAETGLKENVVDFTVCDQVIMHTEDPEKTFRHLVDITKPGGEFACYVYSKK